MYWLCANRDIKKVATCNVKLYQLIDREAINVKDDGVSRKVMLEDGLESVENLMDPEIEEDNLEDVHLDNVGAKHLKLVNSVFFSDIAMYTVELPVSEHGQPEVKEAKMTEVSNLLDYNIFKKS